MNAGRVERVLTVGTVPHQLEINGKVVEATPGSGILEQYVTSALEKLGIDVYKFFPSKHLRESDKVKTLRFGENSPDGLYHDIPIFTNTPCSQFRFDQMKQTQFVNYIRTFVSSLEKFINRIEQRNGPISIVHVSHLFTNMLAMGMVNKSRISDDRKPIPVVAHAHGTAIKFFERETFMQSLGAQWFMGSSLSPYNITLPEIVYSYLKQNFAEALGIKDTEGLAFLEKLIQPTLVGFMDLIAPSLLGVGGIFAISPQIQNQIHDTFPDYPRDSIRHIANGFDPDTFEPLSLKRAEVLAELKTTKTTGGTPIQRHDLDAEHVITFTGKFADWKGLETLLHSAAKYESHFEAGGETVVTLIVGTGSGKQIAKYEGLAEKIGLKHTYFLGQLPHKTIAKLYNISKLGVFPSDNEPFGMVGIECMACGTPPIAGTGGFQSFINDEVGAILTEPKNVEMLTKLIIKGLEENWKFTSKGDAAHKASESYTWTSKVQEMVKFYNSVMKGHNNYRIARLVRTHFNRLILNLNELRLSPALIKKHLLSVVPNADEAEVPAELVRHALKHGGTARTIEQINELVKCLEEKKDLARKK